MPEQRTEILRRRRKRVAVVVLAVLVLYAIHWAEIFFLSEQIKDLFLRPGQVFLPLGLFGSLLWITVKNGYRALVAGLAASYVAYRIAMAFFGSRGVWGVVSLVCGVAALWWTYETTCDHLAEFPLDSSSGSTTE